MWGLRVRPGIWRALKRGDDRRTILAVDFRQARSGSGFEEFAANYPDATEVWQIDEDLWLEPPSLAPAGVPALVDTLFSAVGGLAESRRVIAVMAYCAGASLACALADRIAESGLPAPYVVLFDPFDVDAQVLRYSLRTALESFASDLDAEDLKRIEASVDQPLPDEGPGGVPSGGSTGDSVLVSGDGRAGDLARLAGRIARAYHDLMSLAAASFDLPSELVQELGDTFVAYLRYLVVCGSSPTGYRQGPTLVVLSEGQEPLPLPDSRQLRFGVTAVELLGDPAVMDGVRGSLAAGGSPGDVHSHDRD